MEAIAMTGFAQWLNQIFFALDYAILEWYHGLAQTAFGHVLSPIMNVITHTAWKGAFLILLAVVMLFFRKTRRAGFTALLAMTIGLLIVNILIKPLAARPRPYDFDATLREWWIYAGSHMESDYSFPSGHMNAACAFTSAFVFTKGKKWLIPGLIYIILLGASRNFFIVHYPSDVLAGFFTGVIAGLLAYLIFRPIYQKWGGTKFLRETK